MLLARSAALAAAAASAASTLVVILSAARFAALSPRFRVALGVAEPAPAFAALSAATAVGGLVRAVGTLMSTRGVLVGAGRMAPRLLRVALFMEVRGLPMMVGCRLVVRGRFVVGQAAHSADLGHVPPIPAHLLAAPAADLRHVLAVLAHGLPAPAPGLGVTLRIAVPAAAVAAVTLPAALVAVVIVLVALAACSSMLLGRAAALIVCHDNVSFVGIAIDRSHPIAWLFIFP
jgi:hypothetical protein